MNRLMMIACVLWGLVACSVRLGPSSFTASEDRTLTETHLTPSPIVVEARNGGVEVVADASAGAVKINATIRCAGASDEEAKTRLAASKLSVARGTDRVLTIKPVFAGGERSNDSVNITVRLPDATGVTISTSNGKVRVQGLAGKLQITTSNAGVDVVDHRGDAHVESSNGLIRVERLAGQLFAKTSNAGVTVDTLSGTAEIQTSNGKITLALAPDQIGPVELTTSNASIDVTVGPAFVGEVALGTSNAGVNVDDPFNRVTNRSLGKQGGTIHVGEGGSRSTVNTSNGRIEFRIGGK